MRLISALGVGLAASNGITTSPFRAVPTMESLAHSSAQALSVIPDLPKELSLPGEHTETTPSLKTQPQSRRLITTEQQAKANDIIASKDLSKKQNIRKFILSSSPMYSQQSAIPNEEFDRLQRKFNEYKFINIKEPEIIVLEKLKLLQIYPRVILVLEDPLIFQLVYLLFFLNF